MDEEMLKLAKEIGLVNEECVAWNLSPPEGFREAMKQSNRYMFAAKAAPHIAKAYRELAAENERLVGEKLKLDTYLRARDARDDSVDLVENVRSIIEGMFSIIQQQGEKIASLTRPRADLSNMTQDERMRFACDQSAPILCYLVDSVEGSNAANWRCPACNRTYAAATRPMCAHNDRPPLFRCCGRCGVAGCDGNCATDPPDEKLLPDSNPITHMDDNQP